MKTKQQLQVELETHMAAIRDIANQLAAPNFLYSVEAWWARGGSDGSGAYTYEAAVAHFREVIARAENENLTRVTLNRYIEGREEAPALIQEFTREPVS